MDEFKQIILGDITVGYFFGMLFWSLVGFLIFTWMEIKQRDVSSIKTPKKFKIMFWLKDNWKRFIVTALFIFVQFRFYYEITGQELTPYIALLMGLGSDAISGFSKKSYKELQSDREKLMTQYDE